jgi:dipeptidyl aminopeptidase/acylaminoacyl peptidase
VRFQRLLVSLVLACAVTLAAGNGAAFARVARDAGPGGADPVGPAIRGTTLPADAELLPGDAAGAGSLSTPDSAAGPPPTAIPDPPLTLTPDPYAGYTIDDLAARKYGGGTLEIEAPLTANDAFVRTLVHYPSDGLRIYGCMDVPRGQGPFPVAIVLHGYIPPYRYHTVTYTVRYVDALARAGYIAIHPNLRGYPPSDDGDNFFRAGYAADVLNLIAIIKEQAGQPGPLEQADPSFIGLLGHSMGGSVAIRVATISDDISALVLYGAMSADEQENYAKIDEWSYGWRGREERKVAPADLARIAPVNYLNRISAPVSIHHGGADELVPTEWSLDLYRRLLVLHKKVTYHLYPGQLHTFSGEGDRLFTQRLVSFFEQCRAGPMDQ